MREMIHDGSGEHIIEACARKSTPSIRYDGLRRVLSGETTVDEVLRVTKDE